MVPVYIELTAKMSIPRNVRRLLLPFIEDSYEPHGKFSSQGTQAYRYAVSSTTVLSCLLEPYPRDGGLG